MHKNHCITKLVSSLVLSNFSPAAYFKTFTERATLAKILDRNNKRICRWFLIISEQVFILPLPKAFSLFS